VAQTASLQGQMIPPGNYTLQASAPDLALPQPVKIMLKLAYSC
jgi:hypothetical protein